MDRKIVSDGTKTLIARIGDVEVSRPELITGLFFVGTNKGEASESVLTVQFGLLGWEIRNEQGALLPDHDYRATGLTMGCIACAADWLKTKLENRHRARTPELIKQLAVTTA